MSQENLETVRAGIDALNQNDEINTEYLAADFELHQASSIIDTAGVFEGPEGIRASLRELKESFEDLTFEGERFVEAPDGQIVVLLRVRGTGRGSGIEMDNRIAWVWTFRGDKAVRLLVYEEQDEALEAVGLRE